MIRFLLAGFITPTVFGGEKKCFRQVYRKNLLKCHHTVDCKHHLTLEEVDPWQYLDRFTGGYLPRKQQRARVRKMSAFSEIQNSFRRTLRPINCVPDNGGWHLPAKSFKTEAICLFSPAVHTRRSWIFQVPPKRRWERWPWTDSRFPPPLSKKKKNIRPRLAKKKKKFADEEGAD